uniref:DNA primase, phage/plasmid n=1 Tax=uncultured Caudovirales phage TaxID=2100421 RepID=A0A6J5LAG6_9CAUD|nr:DNA primase, phage/plasmid [uncultured Caudovirales phage]
MPRESLVTIWTTRYAKGWEGHLDANGAPTMPAGGGTCPVVDIAQALDQAFDSDAHFVPYHVRDRDDDAEPAIPRINQVALPVLRQLGYDVRFSVLVFDIDDPVAHANEEPARDSWRAEQEEILAQNLPVEWADSMGFYRTKGGMRVLWRLADHVGINDFHRLRASMRSELMSLGVDQVDDLKDWNRCYRLPNVIREKKRQVLDGDWGFISEGKVLRYTPKASTLAPTVGADGRKMFEGLGNARAAVDLNEKVKAGTRNTELLRRACALQYRGLSDDLVAVAVHAINTQLCDPPLDAEEVDRVLSSAQRYRGQESPDDMIEAEIVPQPLAPSPPPSAEKPKEKPRERAVDLPDAPPKPQGRDGCLFVIGSTVEIVDKLGQQFPDDEDLLFDRGRFWHFSTGRGHWAEMHTDTLECRVHRFDGEWVWGGTDSKGAPKVTMLKIGQRTCEDAVTMMSRRRKAPGFFDSAAPGLAFSDCFVRIQPDGSMTTEPHSKDQRATDAMPFDFAGFDSEPELLLQAMREMFRDDKEPDAKIAVLQEFLGLCLIGRAPQFGKGLILYGEGANGKSTLLNIFSALFPQAAVVSVPPQDMANEYSRAMLATAKINVVNELPEASILASEAVKALITGEWVKAREIRQAPFEFRNKSGQLYSANTLPSVRDMTTGFWRRWIVLEFRREFKDHEQDRGLEGRIVAYEMPQIAAWALQGAVRVLQRGHFVVPGDSAEVLAEWRTSADQVAEFVMEKCEKLESADADGATPGANLHAIYSLWASGKHVALNPANFGRRLKLLGIQQRKTMHGTVYGLKIRAPAMLGSARAK